MKSLALYLMTAAAGAMITAPALACPVRARVFYNRAVVVKEVVTPVVIAEFVPVLVPTYSVTYAPAAYAPPVATVATPSVPAQGAPAADNKALMDRIAALERELEACKKQLGGQPPVPKREEPKAEAGGPPLKLFQTKCAACHEKAVAGDKGNGFVLLDGGKLAPLTDKQLRRVGSKTYSGAMPPKGKGEALTDEEVGQVQDWLDSVK